MTHLTPGVAAPMFRFKDECGRELSLADCKGKKVALFFYPKDLTPGCTAEACNLRDHYTTLQKKGVLVIGVSADTEASHQKFAAKYQLPFPLIADTEKALVKAYGIWGPKKFMGRTFDGIHRTTFLIDEKGKIMHIFEKVATKEHAEQILEILKK
jgi:peroxiredoxin Q/BCP